MTTSSTTPTTAGRRADRFSPDECRIDDFIASIGTETDLADYPYATSVQSNVLVYDAPALRSQIVDPDTRASVGDELARALLTGPGIVVFAGAFDEDTALSESTQIYTDIIDAQHAAGQSFGDHFATPGANDRIWNALQKLALRNPETFVRYYRNDILALICEAWVGPMYQVTSAINVVNPLGAAQNPHRDYHLGFMSTDTATRFRAHQHRLSAALTLQGAVAHVDMPLESGPTMYLPYSQRYEQGYVAFNLPEFRQYFADNHIQLPLRAGDAVFFNPALFHAAGHNTSTDIKRMANLLQVSSAFGRAMDAVDRSAMLRSLYPWILDLAETGDDHSVGNVIASAAEGYAFPSNLDLDQPLTGLAGETQAELVRRAVDGRFDVDQFDRELAELDRRHTP
ncbi:phytanoyl-CoA dioxygenase family protein [Gordonia sp. NB41Y]|uniref:phytanoyl-CoA dioxygenase family protein n=1 Tax=Gordonia sp. NB41Y TaxID=875808 RepID=UPI0002BEC73B|nr:phytanoyl-CoA dioxygenase family protein [Gordonia sp. NB41Y]EMP14593.1 phytanoyl-CoA dioxygenase [Gordonia sp. NB41Y]WLP89803.1 phytanoyl-CoA dioxygenase family protein [Gordonia sp. NB41Y]